MAAGFVALALMVPTALFAAEEETAAVEEKTPRKELKTDAEKLSYAIGLEVGTFLKELKAEVDLGVFLQAVRDAVEDRKPLLTQEQALAIKKEFTDKMKAEQAAEMKKMQAERAAEMKVVGEKNLKAGEEFLEANAKKEGVKTTDSGLQYQVLKEGDGPKPATTDTVEVHYRGTLIDGTEFDSSYKRGQPATFPVDKVIDGWTEALQMMNVGSKYKLFIPPDLAYGERAPSVIGPNAVLVFEVELLAIK
jgi:FKBP-type peptidyl-prolyl cis-trans isomerase